MNQRLQRYTGIFLVVLSLLTVGMGVFFTSENRQISTRNRQITECQAKYNEQFIEQLKVRSEITDKDRNDLTHLFTVWITAKDKTTPRKALEEYLKAKEENDEQRKRHPLKELPTTAQC